MQRILERDLNGGGRIVLDPVDVAAELARGGRTCAGGILVHRHLVVSTISCTSHHDTAAAGIQFDDCSPEDPRLSETNGFRLWLDAGVVAAEIWPTALRDLAHDQAEPEECPIPNERLSRIADLILDHPRVRAAYRGRPPRVEIDVWNAAMDEFRWGWRMGSGVVDYPHREPEKSALSM